MGEIRTGSIVIYTDDKGVDHAAKVGAVAAASGDVMVIYQRLVVEWVAAGSVRPWGLRDAREQA